MFSKLLEKFNSFGDHHQTALAIAIAVILIWLTWTIEKILEQHIYPSNKLYSYWLTLALGLLVLWTIKHFILHVW